MPRPGALSFPRSALPTVPRAFSLAEMMIALVILAMGLLVIGAALPVGLRYTRASVNMATGQAAAEHALDLIESNVCLRDRILDSNGRLMCEPGLFQPRDANGVFDRDYEPIIKVRPLYVQLVDAEPGSGYGKIHNDPAVGRVEEAIGSWAVYGTTKEWDQARWMRWALPSVALVYPPITPDTAFRPRDFLSNMYGPRPVSEAPQGAETRKVLATRVVWTAFYRRVSYAADSDPCLYEFIVVALRLPSERHRFPVQAPYSAGGHSAAVGDGARGSGVPGGSGDASAAPVPWLVTFAELPVPPGSPPFDNYGFPQGRMPPTLVFRCQQGHDGLFPVGTIFIPARNDHEPDLQGLDPEYRVGFGPPAPTALPIYEVVERPDETTVLTKFNGYYPMQGTPGQTALGTPAPADWPVWVIPAPYEEEELVGGQKCPVLADRCPIVGLARRYVRLREVP